MSRIYIKTILLAMLSLSAVQGRGAEAPGLDEITRSLKAITCYSATVDYTVVPPNAPEDVIYRLGFKQQSNPGDTLAPCSYLVTWELREPERLAGSGFSSYSDGNHFRYRPGKLQEYHYADDPAPFAPAGVTSRGVQNGAQFLHLLPAFLSAELETLSADTESRINITASHGKVIVKVTEIHDGYETRNCRYVFEKDMLPVEAEICFNPGQASEQTVTARYRDSSTDNCDIPSEEGLVAMFPEVFEKYRRDSYSLLSLVGGRLPDTAAPTLARERWAHRQDQNFDRPTIIAVLDSSVDSTEGVVEALRAAMDAMPFSADLIMAFTDNDLERIALITGPQRPGEIILTSARAMARDCGVADYPSFIFCRADGSVADVHIGRNNELRSIVIHKATLAK